MKNKLCIYNRITALVVLILSMVMLTGCEETYAPAAEALALDSEGNTSLGIHVGSTYGEFVEAYSGYRVELVNEDGTLDPIDLPKPAKDEVPETEDERLLVACFYIDGEPMLTEKIVEELGTDDIETVLQSAEYLSNHTVIYRYMYLDIVSNAVSDISYDYLDYNTEL